MVYSDRWFREILLQKPLLPATLLAFLFTLTVLMQDRLAAALAHSAYYFSESLLFSTCWMLLPAGWWLQYRLWLRAETDKLNFAAVLILPVLLHLLLFPAVVQGLSGIFYYHTYRFEQVFLSALRHYLHLLLLFYSVSLVLFAWLKTQLRGRVMDSKSVPEAATGPQYTPQLMVQQGVHTLLIPVHEITCIRSSKPYVRIHWQGRTYLQATTLRALQDSLDPALFIRVHKSHLINIRQVSSYASRQNGDYDARLQDGLEIRVSRIYAGAFKAALNH